MAIVALDLDGASRELHGTVARRLLEIRPGVFIGSLSKRAIEQLWAMVVDANPKAALLIYPARNELGLAMKSHGVHRYSLMDHHGIPLIAYCRDAKVDKNQESKTKSFPRESED